MSTEHASLPHATREARRMTGSSRRARAPRTSHGTWAPAPDRDDPIAILERQNAVRIPEYVPIRMGRMAASPFAFLRGSAAVMAADLAATPTSGLRVQAVGDCHIMNFGLFGTQERNLVFGINDFDETLPGPWEWDVKRMAASVVVAGRYVGLPEATAVAGAIAGMATYRRAMAEYAAMGILERWYTSIKFDAIVAAVPAAQRKRIEAIGAKARARTNLQVLGKLTDLVGGDYRLLEDPPLMTRIAEAGQEAQFRRVVEAWLAGYRASLAPANRRLFAGYQLVDVIRKIVGVGSVGTRCFVVLLKGEDNGDPLFLQVKEAGPSVLEPYVGRGRSGHGKRVVDGQRVLQAAPDIFLGWGKLPTGVGDFVLHYYVRQLRDMKGGVELVPGGTRPDGFESYARLCARALALAHSRSGDASAISGYLGTSDLFDQAIGKFAVAYADQTERDHAALLAAIKSGRVAAESDGGV